MTAPPLVLVARRDPARHRRWFYTSARRGHMYVSAVNRMVDAAAARASVSPSLSAHWLRHAHASHALDRGAPIHLVQTTLGHASVATTRRYTHARPADSSARFLAD